MLAIAVVTVLLGAQGFATVSALAVSAGDGTPVTTVSLTWDDGRASQVGTIALHEQRGLRATYYVSSDLIGSSAYYLDRPTLGRMPAAENEIGGHGDRHVDLTTVDLATAQTLVSGDRDRQTVWYPDAGRSFAYPFGSFNADLERIVADCGYQSARAVGGVRTATSCSNCPLAESIPPSDPFALITTSSVRSTTTLDDLKALVEQGTGGWVLPIFHDLGVGGTYSVSVAVYAAFLDWLTTRPATVVRTVADVLSGEPPPTSTTSTSSTSTTPSSTSTSSTSVSGTRRTRRSGSSSRDAPPPGRGRRSHRRSRSRAVARGRELYGGWWCPRGPLRCASDWPCGRRDRSSPTTTRSCASPPETDRDGSTVGQQSVHPGVVGEHVHLAGGVDTEAHDPLDGDVQPCH